MRPPMKDVPLTLEERLQRARSAAALIGGMHLLAASSGRDRMTEDVSVAMERLACEVSTDITLVLQSVS